MLSLLGRLRAREGVCTLEELAQLGSWAGWNLEEGFEEERGENCG